MLAILSDMDRSLNADDYRFLEGLTAAPPAGRAEAPTLDQLPEWFRRVVLEQAACLGLALPEAALGTDRPAPAGDIRAA